MLLLGTMKAIWRLLNIISGSLFISARRVVGNGSPAMKRCLETLKENLMPTIANMMTITAGAEKSIKDMKAVERMNLAKEVKKGRFLVGTATDIKGAKFVGEGYGDIRYYTKDSVIEVWAAYCWLGCSKTDDINNVNIRGFVVIQFIPGENGFDVYGRL